MTDWLLALVPAYGAWIIAAATFLSCLALPIPSSVLMLAAGGFAAAGDLGLTSLGVAALVGAVLGDQLGYAAGRHGGAALLARLEAAPARAPVIARARQMMRRQGAGAVFLTRWLFSPLGPYVNLIAGATGQPLAGFTFWATLGEVLWCGGYLAAGYGFAGNLAAASDFLGAVLGLMASGAVAAGLGGLLWHLAQRDPPS